MRPETLTENAEFQELYRRGRSYVGRFLVVYALERGGARTRVGFTVGKKVGSAVARNRVRRRLREAYRLLYPGIAEGYDLVIVGRTRARDVRFGALVEELKSLLRKAGALTEVGKK
ncbi:MAG: ribonuclease protein component [Bacillota bacterium]|nr:ribonuclease protein component [Bacillota bacterium]